MQKYIVLLSCIIFATVVNAQGLVKGAKNLATKTKPATSSAGMRSGTTNAISSSVAGQIARTGAPKTNQIIPSKSRTTATKSPYQQAQDNITTGIGASTGAVTDPKKHSPVVGELAESITELKRIKKGLKEGIKDKQEKIDAGKTFADFGKSVLLASGLEDPYIGFSVTVFKINVDGKEEIFGVIPSHGLARKDYLNEDVINTNGNDFSVLIKQPDGRDVFLPATLVQTSPESMLDISLVKFSPEAEKQLNPLELAPENGSLNERVYSNGYAMGTETQVERTINSISLISLRANQTIEGDRAGFCGSPWLDANHRVLGIHTGSKVGIPGQEDVSFATHARFVRLLVDAYFNEGTASWNLVLGEHNLATLNIDEYISDIVLFDENGKNIMQHHFDDKFSQSVILNALQKYPNAWRIELTSHKATWDGTMRIEDRSTLDPTKRIHRYNLKTKQTELVYR